MRRCRRACVRREGSSAAEMRIRRGRMRSGAARGGWSEAMRAWDLRARWCRCIFNVRRSAESDNIPAPPALIRAFRLGLKRFDDLQAEPEGSDVGGATAFEPVAPMGIAA